MTALTWWEAAAEAFLGPDEFPTGWTPQPKQELASELSQQADEVLYGGAAGGGKTEWLCEYGIREMEKHPGNRGAIFRRVFPSLNRTIVPRMRTKLHGRAHWNGTEHTFTFPNGSVLELGSLQYADSVIDYQGAEYGWIGFEEITEFLESQWEFLIGRLRAPVDGVRPHACATTNPGGAGHRWVKRRWIRPVAGEDFDGDRPEPFEVWRPLATDERPHPLRRVFIPATLADNPRLTERDPEYVNRLRQISNRGLRRALERGDWDAIDSVEGALWDQGDIDQFRIAQKPDLEIHRKVIAVDPSDGNEDSGDEYGVSVCARGMDGVGYVLLSDGWRASPRDMAKKTVQLYHDLRCDAIVIEKNHGGKWMREVFQVVDQYANIKLVWASEGKKTRAEPVSALFRPDPDADLPVRARFVGFHPELEEECTHFTGAPGEVSPNRLDAMVWAMTELFIGSSEAQTSKAKDDRLKGRR